MSDTPSCSHCGKPLPPDGLYCPICGAGRPSRASSAPDVASIVLMVVLGIVAAIPVFMLITAAGAALLSNVGAAPGSQPEFYVSWGATGFYLFVTLLVIAGFVVTARARMSPSSRAFTIAFLCTALGFFAVCDFFSLSSHG